MAESVFTGMQQGAEAMGSFQDQIAASADLAKASRDPENQEAPGGGPGAPGSGAQPDLYKVYSGAAKMAMAQGRPSVAEKFTKQADTYKSNAIQSERNEMQLEQEQLDKAEQQIAGMATSEDAEKVLMEAKMPEAQKMQWLQQVRATKGNPEAFKEFKNRLEGSMTTAKERLASKAAIAKLEAQKAHWDAQETLALTKLRTSAAKQSGAGGAQTKQDIKDLSEVDKKEEDEIFQADQKYKDAVKGYETSKAFTGKGAPLKSKAIAAADTARLVSQADTRKRAQERRDRIKERTAPKAKAPADHIEYLKAHPTKANKETFDKQYGEGAADKALSSK